MSLPVSASNVLRVFMEAYWFVRLLHTCAFGRIGGELEKNWRRNGEELEKNERRMREELEKKETRMREEGDKNERRM